VSRQGQLGICSGCGRISALRKDGTIRAHKVKDPTRPTTYTSQDFLTCFGVGKPPQPVYAPAHTEDKGEGR